MSGKRDIPDVPRVRVVIPCRNERAYIGGCLRSLIDADRNGLHVEVLVCDGMSDDGTRDEVAKYTRVHEWIELVDNPQRTTPQAMNIGLMRTGFDVGIVLGAHAEVERAFFQNNIAVLRAHPEVWCAGGVIENVYLDSVSRRIGSAMSHPFGVGNAHFRTGAKDGYVDTVAFGAYRREVFEQVGYFDERLVRNQDDEFNYRVVKGGFRIWLSSAVRSRYFVRGTYSKLFRQYKQYGYWKVYVNRLHRTVTTVRQMVPALFVGGVLAGALCAVIWPLLRWPWAIGIGAYALIATLSAVRAASSLRDAPGVLAAFLVLHVAYGAGYLQGIGHFLLLRRAPKAGASALTR